MPDFVSMGVNSVFDNSGSFVGWIAEVGKGLSYEKYLFSY